MINIGDKVENFTWKDESGNTKNFSDYLGQKVALYFYPSDDTPGCTSQACSIRDGYGKLQAEAITIIGISHNSRESHEKFIAKHQLPFPLIADEDFAISNYFGAKSSTPLVSKFIKNKRNTYLIDEKGVLVAVITKIETKNHANQIIEAFNELATK